jgi:hypothetical protein
MAIVEDTQGYCDLLARQQAEVDKLAAKNEAALRILELAQEVQAAQERERANDAPPVETQRLGPDIASGGAAQSGAMLDRGLSPAMKADLARMREVEQEAAKLYKSYPGLKRWDPSQRQGLDEHRIRRQMPFAGDL